MEAHFQREASVLCIFSAIHCHDNNGVRVSEIFASKG